MFLSAHKRVCRRRRAHQRSEIKTVFTRFGRANAIFVDKTHVLCTLSAVLRFVYFFIVRVSNSSENVFSAREPRVSRSILIETGIFCSWSANYSLSMTWHDCWTLFNSHQVQYYSIHVDISRHNRVMYTCASVPNFITLLTAKFLNNFKYKNRNRRML